MWWLAWQFRELVGKERVKVLRQNVSPTGVVNYQAICPWVLKWSRKFNLEDLEDMDSEGIRASLLFPTTGLYFAGVETSFL